VSAVNRRVLPGFGLGLGYTLTYLTVLVLVPLAVIVQEMVQSESSGVLFTANPLTGLRSEAVIDAVLEEASR